MIEELDLDLLERTIHNLEEKAHYADIRIAESKNTAIVMKDGKIQELDDADELYNHPKTDYTRNLIDAIPGRV